MSRDIGWRGIVVVAAWAYVFGLALALALRWLLGDASPLLFAMSSLLLYAFLPVPLLVVVGVWQRSRALLAASAAAVLAWCWLWGGLFVPGEHAVAGPRLRALTYNALGFNLHVEDAVQVVRESDADVVALQELNPELAAALVRELPDAYPYRWLEPQRGVGGGGILSKLPFERSAEQLGGHWTSRPMAIDVRVEGRRVTIVRFHAYSGPASWADREEQARLLSDYARRSEGPVVMLGDLNATDANRAYTIMTGTLRDAWRQAGWGLGHTFPGEPTAREGGSRPTVLGVPVPRWLIRIDYVFHSPGLVAERAEVTPSAGGSDHRGVIATLRLK